MCMYILNLALLFANFVSEQLPLCLQPRKYEKQSTTSPIAAAVVFFLILSLKEENTEGTFLSIGFIKIK